MSQLPESESVGSICWLFVGSTGCGKSSLINTLTDTNVEVGDSNESKTKEASVFTCNIRSDILLMDTVGFEDTDNIPFEEVLGLTSLKLYNEGSEKIKVIWCVKPQDKSTPELQKQAKFINSLNKSIWKSVIIVVKKGNDNSDYKGVIGVAKEYCSNELPIINIHGLDWIPDASKTIPYSFMFNAEIGTRIQKEKYYLKKEEIPEILIKQLSQIQYSNAIKFKQIFYHKENYKFLETKKHLGNLDLKFIHHKTWKEEKKHENEITIEKFHDCGKAPTYGHSGELVKKKRHKSEAKRTEKYHSGTYISKSSYHPETKIVCPSCESSNIKFYSNTIKVFDQIYYECRQCQAFNTDCGRFRYSECGSCNNYFCRNCPYHKCSYCGCKSSSEGCRNNSEWSCCGQSSKNAIGCKEKYLRECCDKDYYKSEGCLTEFRYEYCNHLAVEKECVIIGDKFVCGNSANNGCATKKYYSCCGNGPNSECSKISKAFYECCDNENKNSKGCKDISKYSVCNHGKGTLECAIDYRSYSCCGIKENDKLTKKCGRVEWIPEDFEISEK